MNLSSFVSWITTIINNLDTYNLLPNSNVTLLSFTVYISIMLILLKIIKRVI